MTEKKDLFYDTALELAGEAAKKLFEKVLDLNGIAAQAGGPATKLITIYTKEMMKVYFAAEKYESFFTQMTSARRQMGDHIEFLKQKIRQTPPPQMPPNGPMALFGSLIDPRAAAQLKTERSDLISLVRNVVDGLDGLVEGNSELVFNIAEQLARIDKFAEIDSPRNVLESAYGPGAIYTVREAWCSSAQSLISVSEHLVDHRNRWAKIAALSPIRVNLRRKVESECFIR